MTRSPDETVQLKLRFKEALRRRLEERSERNEASLNSEIVRRLDQSLATEDARGGPATAGLLAAIEADIAEIEAITGKSWAEDAETYAAVRRAMIAAIGDRPPSRVENHEQVVATLRRANEAQKVLLAVHTLGPDIIDVNDEKTTRQIEEYRAEAEAARLAADKAYQPQLAAERRGRKLYCDLRTRRQQALAAQKRR